MTIEQRIRAAVDEVVAATDPDQVVVFGSAAKGTARPDSDIDLLVICDPALHDGGMRTCAATGDDVDVFVTDRRSAERYRYSAAYLEGIALGEGRTVYACDPQQALAAGSAMIRRTLYDPDRAEEWVAEGAERLQQFETKCEALRRRGRERAQGAHRRRRQARRAPPRTRQALAPGRGRRRSPPRRRRRSPTCST